MDRDSVDPFGAVFLLSLYWIHSRLGDGVGSEVPVRPAIELQF